MNLSDNCDVATLYSCLIFEFLFCYYGVEFDAKNTLNGLVSILKYFLYDSLVGVYRWTIY